VKYVKETRVYWLFFYSATMKEKLSISFISEIKFRSLPIELCKINFQFFKK